MDDAKNKEAVRQVLEEAFGKGNLNVLDTLFAPNFIEHQFGMPNDLDGLKKEITRLRTGFPDLTVLVDDIVSVGDKVWVRATGRGTHLGSFLGPPTGKSMTITIIDVARFENGKMCEHWGVADKFAMLAQLDKLPKRPEPNQ